MVSVFIKYSQIRKCLGACLQIGKNPANDLSIRDLIKGIIIDNKIQIMGPL